MPEPILLDSFRQFVKSFDIEVLSLTVRRDLDEGEEDGFQR